MTVNEIVDALRAGPPRASDALRLEVLTLASRPAQAAPTLLGRVRARRRLALLVPAAAGIAVVSAVAVGVTRPQQPAGLSTTPPAVRGPAVGEAAPSPPLAADAGTAQAPAPGPGAGRAQRYGAALSLRVADTDALSDATQQALAIARDLGGYVVSVHYATGTDGAASITLNVPSARAGDAVTRLSSLGTILAQDVQIDDLQASLDTIDRRLGQVRARIAALTTAIERAGDATERARLVAARSRARAELQDLRRTRTATAADARNATIRLDLRTAGDTGVAVPGSRLDRALDKALAVLAWEGVVVLAVAVAAAPLFLVAAAAWATRRARRRREEERLLAAP